MTRLSGIVKAFFLFCLRLYSRYISYYLPSTCRFYPSCSHYAAEAVETHGAWCGCSLALRRLARCHPWHEGGFDPVPAAPHHNDTGVS